LTRTEIPRVVVVTGGSRGLGRAIALRFGRTGDRVVVNYLSHEQGAAQVVKDVIASGSQAVTCRADVKNRGEVDALFASVVDQWGRIDVLVNNAGITRDVLMLRMTEEDWDSVHQTNLTGPFYCIQAASRIMEKQQSGHIINITSLVGVQGREGQANYSASKAGLIGLTKASARELGRFNIQVNAVLPGYLPTEMGGSVSKQVRDRVTRENVLGRVSDPEEAALFIYLLSTMKNISGQIFNLDSRIL